MSTHSPTNTAKSDPKVETQIRELIHRFVAAVKNKDLEGVMADYADDFVAFDLMPPLRIDREKYASYWQMCFDMTEGTLGFEVRNLVIVGGPECAFAYGFSHMTSKDKEGNAHDTYIRLSLGFAKRGNAWKVVHEHTSVPIDMEKQPPEARLDLRP